MDYEDWLYIQLYPSTVRAGSGLNSVTRAIDVALFMGFARIIVLGADCALRVSQPLPSGVVAGTPAFRRWLEESVEMHADGGSAVASGATETTCGGTRSATVETSNVQAYPLAYAPENAAEPSARSISVVSSTV